jgi:hypothetical protein
VSPSHVLVRPLPVLEAQAIRRAAWLYPVPCAAYFLLRTWAGLREIEIRKLDPVVSQSTTVLVGKTRKVELPPNVVIMLEMLRREGRLTRELLSSSTRVVSAVIKKLGFFTKQESDDSGAAMPVWARDIMRHTALSCYLSHHDDLSFTSSWAGHSAEA